MRRVHSGQLGVIFLSLLGMEYECNGPGRKQMSLILLVYPVFVLGLFGISMFQA